MTDYRKTILVEAIENGMLVTVCDKSGHFDLKRHFTDIDTLLEYVGVQLRLRR